MSEHYKQQIELDLHTIHLQHQKLVIQTEAPKSHIYAVRTSPVPKMIIVPRFLHAEKEWANQPKGWKHNQHCGRGTTVIETHKRHICVCHTTPVPTVVILSGYLHDKWSGQPSNSVETLAASHMPNPWGWNPEKSHLCSPHFLGVKNSHAILIFLGQNGLDTPTNPQHTHT